MRVVVRLGVAVLTALAAACASIPGADYPKETSTALDRPESTTLGREVASDGQMHGGNSKFRLLSDGTESFVARGEMAAAAERTLDIQYFAFQDDETGKLLVDSLVRCADRGVRVRLLIDDAEDVTSNPQITALAAQQNIEVRVFNPFILHGPAIILRYVEFFLTATRVNYRMHNKLFIADNSVAIVGGRNIGDEYFEASPDTGFADFDVLAAGPVVPQLSRTFDAYWNSELAIPLQRLGFGRASPNALARDRADRAANRETSEGTLLAQRIAARNPLAQFLRGAEEAVYASAEVLYDSPEKRAVEEGAKNGQLMRHYLAAAIDDVRSELLIASPFVVPGEGGMRLIERVRSRGARVLIVTNSLAATEMPIAHAGYEHYRRRLLSDGVDLCEMRPTPGDDAGDAQRGDSPAAHRMALHGKAFVLDRQRVFIGSMNFDRRSLQLNTEIGLLIDSPELAQQVADHIDVLSRPANCYTPVLGPPDASGHRSLSWRTEENGRVIELASEPMGNLLRGFKTELLSLLPIDELL
jgi:putative cardiolipin synthase